jgi:molecular chaperone DnaK (HSP70)
LAAPLPESATRREQQVILTVPASFDEGARALTLAKPRDRPACRRVRLLEEPQAAFLRLAFPPPARSLAEELAGTRLLLVCDVGGGTTDLTLIQVALTGRRAGVLTRIGVGDHLMLGGDNMDLALAHLVEGRLPASEGRLSAARFSQLTARCRAGQGTVAQPTALPKRLLLTLLGGGARLIGGARTVELKCDEVRQR